MMDEGKAALVSMFPEVEEPVLEAVLRGVGGDAIAAVDALLAMTDEQRLRGALPTEPDAFGAEPAESEGDGSLVNLSGSAALAAQLAEDAELARALQQQMLFEAEFDEQQLLWRQQQQLSSQGPPSGGGLNGGRHGASYAHNYPGQAHTYPGAGAHLAVPDHPNVYRPSEWGVNGPARSGGEGEGEGGSVGDALYTAGSSLYTGAASLWSWAVGEEGAEGVRKRDEEREGAQHESHEMQPMRRVRHGEGQEAPPEREMPPEEDRVLRGDSLGGSGGGEVRRRTRHAAAPSD